MVTQVELSSYDFDDSSYSHVTHSGKSQVLLVVEVQDVMVSMLLNLVNVEI